MIFQKLRAPGLLFMKDLSLKAPHPIPREIIGWTVLKPGLIYVHLFHLCPDPKTSSNKYSKCKGKFVMNMFLVLRCNMAMNRRRIMVN